MSTLPFVYDDGGREAAGFLGHTDDCVTRSIAIATNLSYREVYDALHEEALSDRALMARLELRYGANARAHASPRNGVARRVYDRFLKGLGWRWTSTMHIGSGCTTHLRSDELPMERLIVRCSKHITAVVYGVIRDTHNCSREGTRCVYGYWQPPEKDTLSLDFCHRGAIVSLVPDHLIGGTSMTSSTLPARPLAATGDMESSADSLSIERTPGGRKFVQATRPDGSTYRLTKDTRTAQAEDAVAYFVAQQASLHAPIGEQAAENAQDSQPQGEVTDNGEATDNAAKLAENDIKFRQQPVTPTRSRRSESGKRSAKAAPAASKRVANYGEAIVERSKLARGIDGYKAPASLKMHKAVDETVRRLLGGEPTVEGILSLADAESDFGALPSVEALLPYARSKGQATKRFKRLMSEIPKEADLRPRHIAASLWAMAQQIQAPAESA